MCLKKTVSGAFKEHFITPLLSACSHAREQLSQAAPIVHHQDTITCFQLTFTCGKFQQAVFVHFTTFIVFRCPISSCLKNISNSE